MNKTKAQKAEEKWQKEAERLGLMNEKTFVEAYKSYNHQIKTAENLRGKIREKGVIITTSSGREISNPLILSLIRTEVMAQRLRKELDEKMERAAADLAQSNICL